MPQRACFFLVAVAITITSIGCGPTVSSDPKIVGSVTRFKPVTITPTERYEKPKYTPTQKVPGEWRPPRWAEKSWKAIVIHHSLTNKGNAAIFDRYHRSEHHWKMIGYDFVIGNGKGSGNGQVEVTERWKQQIPGAHCGGTPGNWANVDGIGICLVGDFSKSQPTWSQMHSLARLIRFLQGRYNIPKSRIYGHRDTPGYTNGTKCPGNFPMYKLKKMLR